MNPHKALALVLRVIEFSETSSVVTLLTREYGKVRGLAKGARRPKGPFDAALDLLCLCRVVFLRKSSEGLDLLTEAKLERRFRGRDLSCLYAGYYVAELLQELTHDDDPHPELFDAADRTLRALESAGNVAALVLRFELTALRLLGHLPSLNGCAECGTPPRRTGKAHFGQLSGGVLCAQCRPGKRQVVVVAQEVIDTLECFAGLDWSLPPPEIPRPILGPLRGLLNHYIAHLLGRRPQMHPYLGVLLH